MNKVYTFEGARRFFDDNGTEVMDIDPQASDYTLVISTSYELALKLRKHFRDCSLPKEIDLSSLHDSTCSRLILSKGFTEDDKRRIIAHLPDQLYNKLKSTTLKDQLLRAQALSAFSGKERPNLSETDFEHIR